MCYHQIPLPVIDFTIITVARSPQYIHELIACLRPDLGLRLVVGTPDCDYLKRYRVNPFIEIIEPLPHEWECFQNCVIHQRATWNYWRTLNFGAQHPCRQGMVIFEDDIIPAQNWEKRLYDIIGQIETGHSSPYILTLYASQVSLPEPANGSYYVHYPTNCFYGTQAVYYPEPVRKGFSEYLKTNLVHEFRVPYDFLLREYAEKEGISIFAAIPCLFQHIGEISTGLGIFHRTEQFKPKL
jgi:hypothetical protein